jgi:ribosomal protein S18 acetylase RimI-like enzyme
MLLAATFFLRDLIMAELTQRPASLGDLKGIWGLMRLVAADIPLELDSEAAQESMLSELMVCCTLGLSPVALGEDKSVVGAILVKRNELDWGLRNGNSVQLSYAAVAPDYRDQGVLKALVGEIQQRGVPVFATVKSGDKLGLAEGLTALGFTHESAAANEGGDIYKWKPSQPV